MPPRALLLLLSALLAAGAVAAASLWWEDRDTLHEGARHAYLQRVGADAARIRWRSGGTSAGDAMVVFRRAGSADPFQVADVHRDAWCLVADLAGLEPATRYEYALLRRGQFRGSGPVPAGVLPPTLRRVFRTAPRPGDAAEHVRFWALGCSGHPGDQQVAVRDAGRLAGGRDADFLLFLGDNAYWNGTDEEFERGFFGPFARDLARRPAYLVVGNHDVGASNPRIQSGPLFDLFDPPARGELGGVPSGREAFYSFDWGPVHVVVLDSETTHAGLRARMIDWLHADLAAARASARWLVAAVHHPPYSRGDHDSDDLRRHEMAFVRTTLVPILEAGGADVVLSAHAHLYTRSHPLAGHTGTSDTFSPDLTRGTGATPAPDGAAVARHHKPAGLTAGTGTLYVTVGSSSKVDDLPSAPHPALAVTLATPGSLLVTATGERLEGRFVAADGTTRDAWVITKDPAGPPPEGG